jgi:hypothetical protein
VPQYLDAAKQAATFIERTMWRADTSTLVRRYRKGNADIQAYAEDYAYLVFGLLELFQADLDPRWLTWAATLQRRQDQLFWDETAGGWFSTTGRDPSVLLRMKEDYDGAEPAASSVSVMNLLALSHLAQEGPNDRWSDKIDRTIALFGPRLEQVGRAVPMMAAALSTYSAGLQQIVIVKPAARGERTDADAADPLERAVTTRYLPFSLMLIVAPEQQRALSTALPLVAAMHPVNGQPAAYVCKDFVCLEPATTVESLDEALNVLR